MERISVSSSNIATVGYDQKSSTLEIAFHSGGVYQYHGVPQDIYTGFIGAASHGSYFHDHIRSVYPYKKVG